MHKKRWDIQPHEVERIETMAAMGLNGDSIARIMGVSKDTFDRALKKNAAARAATQRGRDVADLNVATACYENATKHNHFPAQQFWLRCRAGWKEAANEPPPPININVVTSRVEKEVKELPKEKVLELAAMPTALDEIHE